MGDMPEREKLDEPVCDSCSMGFEYVREQEKECMEEYGWYCHHVMHDDGYPNETNVHTHGLPESFGHLDLQICLSLPQETAHGIICSIVGFIKEGRKYSDGEVISGDKIISGDFSLRFLKKKENGRDVLRVIFPDPAGNIDYENIDPLYKKQWE